MAGEFRGLLMEQQIGRVNAMIVETVAKSFDVDKSRQTEAEKRRRISICLEGFKMLRGDARYRWGVERIGKELPRLLRAKLDGFPYEPDTRSVWIPDDGAV
jgi:hypothetical protein